MSSFVNARVLRVASLLSLLAGAGSLSAVPLTLTYQVTDLGGGTNWTNCVLACNRCNQAKDDRTPSEAGMQLIRQPWQPSRDQLILHGVNVHDAWKPFLKDTLQPVQA